MSDVSLRDLVLYVVSRFPKGVGRTRLMKMLFLVDMYAGEGLGRSLTGVDWFRWKFGPFSREVLDVLDELEKEGLVAVDLGPERRYIALAEPEALPDDVRRVVDRVVAEYGFKPLRELLAEVYERFKINERELGERIAAGDGKLERLVRLAEAAGGDEGAYVELMGRLYEEYEDVLDAVPPDMLSLYGLAVLALQRSGKGGEVEKVTRELVEVLDEVGKVLRSEPNKPLPRPIRERVSRLYSELLDAATGG
ncbi:Panacea domain-containing protein [Pyrobaculum neutrophilum]|uniref:Antitoxin SocA-like Panacea domain-containing protein n=1 Tax=Pyrobaculum neutrophilum (strain DSM 2338 / JCM 9278 / NBRC 100436 / V24Sta) TaxID=444157 RepID=B1Y8K6_PYRNV|nr:Panacea domain-containing protein [Pyrobaculum neutrophilum]ACB40085.1 hypothetical protein Tneu_1156 [Pyrobaculum neutrophilum V24Sta]